MGRHLLDAEGDPGVKETWPLSWDGMVQWDSMKNKLRTRQGTGLVAGGVGVWRGRNQDMLCRRGHLSHGWRDTGGRDGKPACLPELKGKRTLPVKRGCLPRR